MNIIGTYFMFFWSSDITHLVILYIFQAYYIPCPSFSTSSLWPLINNAYCIRSGTWTCFGSSACLFRPIYNLIFIFLDFLGFYMILKSASDLRYLSSFDIILGVLVALNVILSNLWPCSITIGTTSNVDGL